MRERKHKTWEKGSKFSLGLISEPRCNEFINSTRALEQQIFTNLFFPRRKLDSKHRNRHTECSLVCVGEIHGDIDATNRNIRHCANIKYRSLLSVCGSARSCPTARHLLAKLLTIINTHSHERILRWPKGLATSPCLSSHSKMSVSDYK